MRRLFEAVAVEVKRRIDLRCSYCGASLLFGRHKASAPFVTARAILPLVISPEQLSARLADAFLAACIVALGYLVMTSCFVAHEARWQTEPDSRSIAEATEPTTLAAAAGNWSALFLSMHLADLSLTPSGKFARRFESSDTETRARVDPREPSRASLQLAEPSLVTAASLSPHTDRAHESDSIVTGSIKQLAGMWGPDVRACRKSTSKRTGYLPMLIASDKAQAGEATCRLHDVQQSGSEWTVTAQCAVGPKRWTSRVRLSLSGSRLSWKSARGSQDYVKCNGFAVAAR